MLITDLDCELLSDCFVRHIDMRVDGFFVAMTNKYLRSAIHRAFLVWQRGLLRTLRWPGHDVCDPLVAYTPMHKTTCLLHACFVSEARLLYTLAHLAATQESLVYKLIWQMDAISPASKQRFDLALAHHFPYDPRQARIPFAQRIQSDVAGYRMTARGINALLKAAPLRVVRRCFLECLSGHATAKICSEEPHDQALVDFAARHGRVDVLNLMLHKNTSHGLSFDYKEGLVPFLQALVDYRFTHEDTPQMRSLTNNLVVKAVISACGNGKPEVVAWFVRSAMELHASMQVRTPLPTGSPPKELRFFFSKEKTYVAFQMLKAMMTIACANEQEEVVEHLWVIASVQSCSNIHSIDERIMLYMIFWFVTLTTQPHSAKILQKMIFYCHLHNDFLKAQVIRMFEHDIAEIQNDFQLVAWIRTWFDVLNCEEWCAQPANGKPRQTTDLLRVRAIVRGLCHRCGSLLTQSALNTADWDNIHTAVFERPGISGMTKLLIQETSETSGSTCESGFERQGWLFRTWERMERGGLDPVSLRPTLDPERWTRSEAIARNAVRVLLSTGSRSMEVNPMLGSIDLQDVYQKYHLTRLHVNSTHGYPWTDGVRLAWLPLGINGPDPFVYDASGKHNGLPFQAFLAYTKKRSAIGEAVCAWWDLLQMQSTYAPLDPLFLDAIRKAPCQVFEHMLNKLDAASPENLASCRAHIGKIMLMTLDRELSMQRSIEQVSFPLVAMVQWAQRRMLIPQDEKDAFLDAMLINHKDRSPEFHALAAYALNEQNSVDGLQGSEKHNHKRCGQRQLPSSFFNAEANKFKTIHTPVFKLNTVKFRW